MVDFDGWTCPVPLRDYPNVVLGHGGGGKLSAELVQYLFLPAFQNTALESLGDSAVVTLNGQRLAFSTDSYVVRPLFFAGGCIGDLAVHGTVNDIAMMGAKPLFLSTGFILEEGLPLTTLHEIVERMADAAQKAGVLLVTGDTKVVENGHGDGVYINTSGIGIIPEGVNIAPQNAQVGDVVLLSGTIGNHGMAVLSQREGLEFETKIVSDSAALNGLVETMLSLTKNIHVLRDPTRGGVASSLNEIAQAAQVGICIEETKIPVEPAVRSACEMLGMDALYIANEGKLLAIVPEHEADRLLAAMRQHPLGQNSVAIGRVVSEHRGLLTAKTALGATRLVDMQVGEQLPRIC
jgi:hydrogenase expression/formation protein HypE